MAAAEQKTTSAPAPVPPSWWFERPEPVWGGDWRLDDEREERVSRQYQSWGRATWEDDK